jgi:hypothetical protein
MNYIIIIYNENFKKNPRAESWDNVIDLKTKHLFPVETNFPVAQQFVASLRNMQKKDGSEKTAPATGAAGRRYLSSQYFADSSLSQDVSQSSFFGSGENEGGSQTSEEVIHVPDKAKAAVVEVEQISAGEGTALDWPIMISINCCIY